MTDKLCFDIIDGIVDNFSSEIVMPAQVKLPEFWPLQAALWFARADAEFVAKSVTVEQTKYAHVVAALPVEVAARISDEILSPDAEHPYRQIRQRLLDTYTLDEFQRFCGLIDMPARPADRPSALLDAMFAFLPEGVSREEPGWMFKNLFLRRLPSELRTLLMPHKAETVRQLAARGDELWSGMRAATPISTHAIDVDDLPPPPPPPPSQPPVQLCCSVRDGQPATVCYYHNMYGVKATRCSKPCSWKPKNGRGRGRN